VPSFKSFRSWVFVL